MSDYFDRVERQLVSGIESGAGRSARIPVRAHQVFALAGILVVIAVGAVILSAGGQHPGGSAAAARVSVVLEIPGRSSGTGAGSARIQRAVAILRARLTSAFRSAQVERSDTQVLVTVTHGRPSDRARLIALAAPGELEFYDWEANALTPSGTTVASQLQKQDPSAVTISQGAGSASPGSPGAGSLSLYQAVKLASRQPALVRGDNARRGPQYYLFGAPGSAACAAAAQEQGQTPAAGIHCLLSGPDASARDLLSAIPAGVSASGGEMLVVPTGTVVLQAADLNANQQTSFTDPRAQFYVLRDHAALSGSEITNPRQSTDQAGNPDVKFGFTSKGASAFQKVTSQIARRGDVVSGLGIVYNQHFAVAMDNKLVTVPQIDFKAYPDGIPTDSGADITSGFTITSAQDFASLLRFGPLPVTLRAMP